MYKLLTLTLLLTLVSCRTYKPHNSTLPSDTYTRYVALLPTVQDSNGFVDTGHCDSILHTALISVIPGTNINLSAAEIGPGQWLRRPANYPECFESGESRSTISRDMILGVIWSAVANKDLEMLERLWEYGSSHAWIMGTPFYHTILNPNMVSLLSRAIEKLGGEKYIERKIPLTFGDCDGYVCHLTALQIALYGYIEGDLSSGQINILKKLVDKAPANVLFQALYHKYTNGDYSAVKRLMAKYPTNRLPTNKDWCDEWPVQRTEVSQPCDTPKQHSGGELLFIIWLIAS